MQAGWLNFHRRRRSDILHSPINCVDSVCALIALRATCHRSAVRSTHGRPQQPALSQICKCLTGRHALHRPYKHTASDERRQETEATAHRVQVRAGGPSTGMHAYAIWHRNDWREPIESANSQQLSSLLPQAVNSVTVCTSKTCAAKIVSMSNAQCIQGALEPDLAEAVSSNCLVLL